MKKLLKAFLEKLNKNKNIRKEQINEIINNQRKIIENQKVIKYEIETRFYALYKNNSESILESKNRFFSTLEPLNESIKLVQKGCLKLFEFFNNVCQENNINYTIISGTLLGAIRHKGFIPWDDDLDVMMEHDDYIKFSRAISNNNKFEIITRYHRVEAYQLKKLVFKNHNYLFFIDIFIVEKSSLSADETINIRTKIKNEIFSKMNHLLNQYGVNNKIFLSNEVDKELNIKLEKLFSDARERFVRKIYNGKITNYVKAVENQGRIIIFGKDFYPLKPVKFCSINAKMMNNYNDYLNEAYHDYYTIPFDLFKHVHSKRSFDKQFIIDEELFLKNV